MGDFGPAGSADPARWLRHDQVDWWDLVRYGPPGFEAYVRIAFRQEDAAGEDPTVEAMRDAPSLAWLGSAQGYQEPHLVWPEDHAWCLACEVDEEIEFSVGCSRDAARALVRALPGSVRPSRFGEQSPVCPSAVERD